MIRITSIEELFKEHYASLCYFAVKILGDSKLSEDVVQDAFLAYWQKNKEVSADSICIKFFLYSTVRFTCYKMIRREKVVQKYHRLNQNNDIEHAEILNEIIHSEVLDAIYKIMKSLPEGCQMVFKLGYLEGLSNPEIADQLGISVNTVKTHKQRGLRLIRRKLNPELFALIFI